MTEESRDRRRVSGFGGSIMQRIAISIVLAGLLAACGQQSPGDGERGVPVAQLDFIESVPIDKDAPAPIAQPQPQPQPATKKEQPKTEAAAEDKAPEAEVLSARQPSSEPAATADDAAAATRQANQTTVTPDAGATTGTPDQPN